MKASIGFNGKKYSHKFDFRNYTTNSFGAVQPLFQQYMNKADKISLNCSQIVRLAPMPVPTLGDLQVVNKFRFVPMCDLYPYFDALLAGRSVNTGQLSFIPNELPHISNFMLLVHLLYLHSYSGGSVADVLDCCAVGHYSSENSDIPFNPTDSHLPSLNTAFYDALVSFSDGYLVPSPSPRYRINFSNYTGSHSEPVQSITKDNCDFVIINYSTYGQSRPSGSTANVFYCRWNNVGRRIINILRGLGYSCEILDKTMLDLLPVFAFAKAYFDEFAPQREINWHQTKFYSFLNYINQRNIINFFEWISSSDNNASILLSDCLFELSNSWFTFENDWLSAHTSFVINPVAAEGVALPSPDSSSVTDNSVSGGNNVLPHVNISWSQTTQFHLDALRMLTRRVSKESVIGGRIYDYIKNKYGVGVADDMFAESNRVGSFSSNCHVGDVLSNSDTIQRDGSTIVSGDFLGSYAGIGLGDGKGKLKFTAPNFGFVIGMFAVVPSSKTYQGNDPSLINFTRQSLPNSDYDALGYELTPRSSIYDFNGCAVKLDGNNANLRKGFGFLPRLSSWKVKKDIVNGCMRFRSVSASFAPYHLDRSLVVERIAARNDFDNLPIVNIENSFPDASTAWRYIGKYPNLGMFNRIFYNNNEDVNKLTDDNFIIDTTFNLVLTNCLKPIGDSYQAFDEDKDNGSSSVSVE